MSDEGEPDVHPSLRCIIAQYDSEEERREQEGVEATATQAWEVSQPPQTLGKEGDELISNEDGGGDGDDQVEEDESGEEEEEDVDANSDVPEPPNRRGRLKRDNSFNSFNKNDYKYGQIPSPPTEVSSSESDEEYRPNHIPKAKASPAKSPRKATEVKVEPKEEVESPPAEGRVECRLCGHSYSNAYNLTRHRRNGSCTRNRLNPPSSSNSQKPKGTASNSPDKRRKTPLPKSRPVKDEIYDEDYDDKVLGNQFHLKCCLCKEQFSHQDELKRHFVKSHPEEETEEMLERSLKDSALSNRSRSPPRKRLRCRSKVKYQLSSDSEGNYSIDEMAYIELAQRSSTEKIKSPVSPDIVALQPQQHHVQVTDEMTIKVERDDSPLPEERTRTNSGESGVNNSGIIISNGKFGMIDKVGPRKFKCEFCGKLFRDRYALNVHRRVHTGEKPFKCPICVKRYARQYQLTVHLGTHKGPDRKVAMELINSFNNRFTCIECGQQFNKSSNLAQHIKTQHPSWDGRQLPSEMGLIQSTNESNANISQTYTSLSPDQEDYSDLIDYMRFSDDETESSVHLDIRGQLKNSAIFKPPHNVEDDYEDDVMPLILPYMRTLQRIKKRLPTKTGIRLEVNGDDGGDSHDKKVNLDMDKELLAYFLDPSIPVDTSTPHAANMENGNMEPQANETVRQFKCRNCKKCFLTESKLNIHMKSHDQPFQCSLCKRRFSSSQNLKNHMNTHTGEKPHRCTDCGLGFYSAQVLWVHKKQQRCHKK